VTEGYRPFKLKSIKLEEKSITLEFKDSDVCLHVPHSKFFGLLLGRTLWVNGRRGNKDDRVQGLIDVEDMRLS